MSLSRRLAPTLAAARRDLAALTAGLRGAAPPPFHARDASAWGHKPRPTRPVLDEAETPGSALTWQARIQGRALTVPPGQTLLQAGRKAGLDLPFSCTVGGCGTCRHRLISGQVSMPAQSCLSEAERAAGQILLCVARPLSPVEVERLT